VATSLTLHAAVVGGGLLAWTTLSDSARRPVARTEVYRERPVPDDALGTPGEGTAFLEQAGEQPVRGVFEGRPQPMIDQGATATPTRAREELAEALATPASQLPAGPTFEELAGNLGQSAEPEAEDEPREESPPEASSPQAEVRPGQDRASPAVSEEKVPFVDIRTGETISGGDIDFKPRLLRAGLWAYTVGVRGRTMRVRLVIDGTGTPISVAILESSGSSSVDELVERSLFEWWFDPEDQAPDELFEFRLRL